MIDRMDEILLSIGNEANAQIDFEAAFAEVLAQAQAKEDLLAQEVTVRPARKRVSSAQIRALSMAAGAVVLISLAMLLRQGGLMKGAGSPAPQAAAPELAMATAEASDAGAPSIFAAPQAPAALDEAAREPAAGALPDSTGGILGQTRIEESTFYSSAAITVPATDETLSGAPKTGEKPQSTSENGLLINGSHDAHDAEGGICMIGTMARSLAQEKLTSAGYSASFSTDAHEDQLAALAPGEACIAFAGEIAVWNTGDGFLTLWNPALSQVDLYDILVAAMAE